MGCQSQGRLAELLPVDFLRAKQLHHSRLVVSATILLNAVDTFERMFSTSGHRLNFEMVGARCFRLLVPLETELHFQPETKCKPVAYHEVLGCHVLSLSL